jgi:hypothetical protein
LNAGLGVTLSFTNLTNNRSYLVNPSGSVERVTTNVDGSTDYEDTGNNVLILFPGDSPTGPSTIQYTGRLAFHQTVDFVTTVTSFFGRTTDICAAIY